MTLREDTRNQQIETAIKHLEASKGPHTFDLIKENLVIAQAAIKTALETLK